MASSNIFVSPSTSLILIKSLALSTNIFLPTLNVPNFEVKIRDATGSALLATNPIFISTTGGAKFIDNTFNYAINQPYGFVNVGLRNSTIWQVLHTSGQLPADSAANVETLNISTTYFHLVSTAQKNVSSLFVENLQTPNSITLQGPFIVGNLSTPGFVQMESTLNVYGNAQFDKSLFVSGSTQFLSSLSVETLLSLSSVLRSYSSVGAGGSLFVGESVIVASTFYTRSTLQVNTLAVQKETPDITTELGYLQVAGSISTVKQLAVSNETTIQENLQIYGPVSSLQGVFTTGTLITTGDITVFGNLSTLSTASFYSSFTTLSSLFINESFDAFSTANVANLVSTNIFRTNLLSSGTSFSTAGDFTILSTLFVKGTLSTGNMFVGNLFSTGNITVAKDISTFGSATFASFVDVGDFARLQTLYVSTNLGIGSNLDVAQTLSVDSLDQRQDLLIGQNFTTTGETIIRQNVGVESDIVVKGNMRVLGIPFIGTFDVDNYQISTLQIQTSSPSVALRVSTLQASTIRSNQAKLVYSPTSGDVSIRVFSTPTFLNEIYTQRLYAKQFSTNLLTVNSLYTDSILHADSQIPIQSLPKFEIYQKSSFPRGLSTLRIQTDELTGDLIIGNFIGDGQYLSDVQPPFSTLSAITVTASSITTKTFSTIDAIFRDGLKVSTNLQVFNSLSFGQGGILSTGIQTETFPFLQPLNEYILGINNTLYFDSSNRRVGVNTSTPLYNFDIRGSLYFSGDIQYSSINVVSFSTFSTSVSFSSILYSSIYAQDSVILPPLYLDPVASNQGFFNLNTNLLSFKKDIGTIDTFEFEIDFYKNTFNIGEQYYPQGVQIIQHGPQGIFTNRLFSTITLGQTLNVYNNTKNVGIFMFTTSNDGTYNYYSPKPLPSSFDLTVLGDFRAEELLTSTLLVNTTVTTSTLQMPQLGINTGIVSTFNTFSTSLSYIDDALLNWSLTIDNFVEFAQEPSRKGSMFINRPSEPFESGINNGADLSVYSTAYFSTLFVSDYETQSIFLGIQDL